MDDEALARLLQEEEYKLQEQRDQLSESDRALAECLQKQEESGPSTHSISESDDPNPDLHALLQEEEYRLREQRDQLSESDRALAERLQKQEESGDSIHTLSDLDDPNPDLHALFVAFNDMYFSGQLAAVEVTLK